MQEPVGTCKKCGKALYCLDGFFNGVKESGAVFCFDCSEEEEKDQM
ncbi:hypothetical protein [Bacillus sp. FJAT-27231]|nr:hypothetical protein [Bacillus sp. FJAT-27231]